MPIHHDETNVADKILSIWKRSSDDTDDEFHDTFEHASIALDPTVTGTTPPDELKHAAVPETAIDEVIAQVDFPVIEDIPEELEHFVRLYRYGLWVESQSYFEEVLADHLDYFSVAAEYADFLLEQGSYGALESFTEDIISAWGSPVHQDVSEDELQLFRLHRAFARLHTRGSFADAVNEARKAKSYCLHPSQGSTSDVGLQITALAYAIFNLADFYSDLDTENDLKFLDKQIVRTGESTTFTQKFCNTLTTRRQVDVQNLVASRLRTITQEQVPSYVTATIVSMTSILDFGSDADIFLFGKVIAMLLPEVFRLALSKSGTRDTASKRLLKDVLTSLEMLVRQVKLLGIAHPWNLDALILLIQIEISGNSKGNRNEVASARSYTNVTFAKEVIDGTLERKNFSLCWTLLKSYSGILEPDVFLDNLATQLRLLLDHSKDTLAYYEILDSLARRVMTHDSRDCRQLAQGFLSLAVAEQITKYLQVDGDNETIPQAMSIKKLSDFARTIIGHQAYSGTHLNPGGVIGGASNGTTEVSIRSEKTDKAFTVAEPGRRAPAGDDLPKNSHHDTGDDSAVQDRVGSHDKSAAETHDVLLPPSAPSADTKTNPVVSNKGTPTEGSTTPQPNETGPFSRMFHLRKTLTDLSARVEDVDEDEPLGMESGEDNFNADAMIPNRSSGPLLLEGPQLPKVTGLQNEQSHEQMETSKSDKEPKVTSGKLDETTPLDDEVEERSISIPKRRSTVEVVEEPESDWVAKIVRQVKKEIRRSERRKKRKRKQKRRGNDNSTDADSLRDSSSGSSEVLSYIGPRRRSRRKPRYLFRDEYPHESYYQDPYDYSSSRRRTRDWLDRDYYPMPPPAPPLVPPPAPIYGHTHHTYGPYTGRYSDPPHLGNPNSIQFDSYGPSAGYVPTYSVPPPPPGQAARAPAAPYRQQPPPPQPDIAKPTMPHRPTQPVDSQGNINGNRTTVPARQQDRPSHYPSPGRGLLSYTPHNEPKTIHDYIQAPAAPGPIKRRQSWQPDDDRVSDLVLASRKSPPAISPSAQPAAPSPQMTLAELHDGSPGGEDEDKLEKEAAKKKKKKRAKKEASAGTEDRDGDAAEGGEAPPPPILDDEHTRGGGKSQEKKKKKKMKMRDQQVGEVDQRVMTGEGEPADADVVVGHRNDDEPEREETDDQAGLQDVQNAVSHAITASRAKRQEQPVGGKDTAIAVTGISWDRVMGAQKPSNGSKKPSHSKAVGKAKDKHTKTAQVDNQEDPSDHSSTSEYDPSVEHRIQRRPRRRTTLDSSNEERGSDLSSDDEDEGVFKGPQRRSFLSRLRGRRRARSPVSTSSAESYDPVSDWDVRKKKKKDKRGLAGLLPKFMNRSREKRMRERRMASRERM
ncbi:hypothetical protein B9Z65_7173 [Elsinoe australis]|uniref:Uncharacterized protein n=1 Tax=Elsinoe australis TaxID=40998 RepID=A0A2P7Z634_9PEZI|nr:hypothetical protein B9Z65_7173 [Elsinoe australis]